MLTRGPLITVLFITLASASVADVGLPWLLQSGLGAGGWRFEKDYIAWPGNYWRGPDQPPCVASPTEPCTWGTLRLGGKFAPPRVPQVDVGEVVVPLADQAPVLNGAIGYDEWREAAEVIYRYGEGQEFFLLLQRSDTMLYACLAAPSLVRVRQGQVAELYFDASGGQQAELGTQHLLVRLVASRGDAPVRMYTGNKGSWTADRLPSDKSTGPKGAIAPAGDSAWPYFVAEFAVPLGEIGPADCLQAPLGFMARLQTRIGAGDVMAPVRLPEREAVYWPDGRTNFTEASQAPLSVRPDFWAPIIVSADDVRQGLNIPCTTQKVKVDGQLGVKEWQDASRAEYVFPGDQWRVMWAQQAEGVLYVAVRMRTARGVRQDEACGLYLDPCGDGGLRPRGDDLLYRLPLGVDTAVEALTYKNDEWCKADCEPIAGACYPLNAYESCYEFAIPCSALKGPLPPNLAVEVSYELPR